MVLDSIHEFIKQKGYEFEVSELNSKWQKTIDRNGNKVWYVGTDHGNDFVTFSFGDFRESDKRFFFTSKEALTADDEKRLKKFEQKVEHDKSLRNAIAKDLVQTLWSRWDEEVKSGSLDEKLEPEYLKDKKLPRPPGVHVYQAFDNRQNVLVIPMRDTNGELWNIQQIYASGDKAFHPGARSKGLFYEFGHEITEYILVGEGFATCAAAHLATGLTTVCAFNLNNLEAAVLSLGERGFAFQKIVMLADWDGATYARVGKNPGMLEVQKLARKYQVRYALPILTTGPGYMWPENVDFADLWKSGSQEILKTMILSHSMGSELLDYSFSVPKEPKAKKSDLSTAITEELTQLDTTIESNIMAVSMFDKIAQAPETPMPMVKVPIEVETRGLQVATREVVTFGKTHSLTLKHQEPMEFPTLKDGFILKEMKNNKVIETPDFDGFSKYMANRFQFIANDAFLYIYKDGFYNRVSVMELEKLVASIVKQNSTPHLITQFARHAKLYNFVKLTDLVEPRGLINLKNGILDVRTRKLLNHSPEFFFQYCLPHEYIEGAVAPEWLAFLERTFEGNQELVNVCAEIFGYILLGGEPFLHKAIVLSGEGRNGKSTFLDVLKHLIGKTNFSSIPISQLDKPFSVVMADGKLANIVGETTAKEINSEAFKTACSGEELIASQKGLPEYPLAFNARIVMACNKLPHLGDATIGAYEKFFILPFDKFLQEETRIVLFAQRYLFPETPGVINWALEGLQRLILRGQLPKISAVNDKGIELRREIDTVFAWMEQHVTWGGGEVLKFKPADWYENYMSWCREEQRPHVSKINFSKRISAEVRKLPNYTTQFPKGMLSITGRVTLSFKPMLGANLQY
jgi:P4 family phage/plasmid primase-like protien